MIRKTRDSLGIFWDGEEVNGILFYGFWRDSPSTDPNFPLSLWPIETEHRISHMGDTTWHVLLWEVHLPEWPEPDAWRPAIKATLQSMCDAGAVVAWCGLEGFFLEPPNLFHDPEMEGAVWAAMDARRDLHGPPDLDAAFHTISNDVLEKLRTDTQPEV